jgi:hypothetical protein
MFPLILSWLMPASECIMACAEYLRLNQHYGAALRRWAQIESSSNKSELFDARRRQALEIEQTALNERNAAYERMVFMTRAVRSVIASTNASLTELSELS